MLLWIFDCIRCNYSFPSLIWLTYNHFFHSELDLSISYQLRSWSRVSIAICICCPSGIRLCGTEIIELLQRFYSYFSPIPELLLPFQTLLLFGLLALYKNSVPPLLYQIPKPMFYSISHLLLTPLFLAHISISITFI